MPQRDTNPAQPELHEMTVEKWVYGGRGLGRLQGEVVLVPFVLPGERVRVRIERRKSGLAEAALEEVLDPSPERIAAPCPYFGRCGGCHYQHTNYKVQLALKVEILRETIHRTGKLAPPDSIAVVASEPYGYRNRAQFHIRAGQVGYLEAGSNRLCPVQECAICSPGINSALGALRHMTRDRRFPGFLRAIEVFTNESELQLNVISSERPVARRFFEWCEERMPGASAPSLEYAACGERFRVSRHSFFQVNRFLVDRLVEAALEEVGEGAGAWDLYAGVGLFTLALGRRFQRVTAVEGGAGAAKDLEFNVERAGVGVQVERSPVEAFLAQRDRAPEFVLADPPRTGLGSGVVRELLRLRPAQLVIVSCDPATLARDLAGLTAGGYRLSSLALVDLFPQTYHLEAIARLNRTG